MNNLIERAKEASKKAYCPYSNFIVGATVRTDKGIFAGCNVENASYGLTNCAERTAIFAAVAAGARAIFGLAIYTPTKEPTAPCGACRQVIREFVTGDIPIWCESKKVTHTYTLSELLPYSFGPENLK